MSAFVVSDEHISGMLQVAAGDPLYYYWGNEPHYVYDVEKAGQILVDENYRSVNHRYSENDPPHEYRRAAVRNLSMLEIIKLCNSYSYQSCETNDWGQTEAYAIVDSLRERAIRRLPGYEDANWSI